MYVLYMLLEKQLDVTLLIPLDVCEGIEIYLQNIFS